MNHFLNKVPPQVQAEIIKGITLFLNTGLEILGAGLLIILVKFKYRRVRETHNDKKSTVIEFEGGFKQK